MYFERTNYTGHENETLQTKARRAWKLAQSADNDKLNHVFDIGTCAHER